MKKAISIVGILSILVLSGVADARVGGGRSMGFRGSRGFTPRSATPTNPYQSTPFQQQPQQANPGAFGAPAGPFGGGGFMRGMMGGIAGGFLGSMLARSLGYGGMGMEGSGGGGGFGMLEILLLAALGFFLVRRFMTPQPAAYGTAGSIASAEPIASPVVNEADYAKTLSLYDPSFELNRFKEQRMDDFLNIQSAWNTRDLNPVQSLIAPGIRETLESDVNALKQARQINKLENIAVRGTDLVESWQEGGKEYATLNFRARLLDYTLDETSQAVVAGNRTQPVQFEEEWTFVRDCGQPSSPWKLSAISN